MRNQFVYVGWIRVWQYYFFYLSVIIENVSVTSKAVGGDKTFTLCSIAIPNLTCFKDFASRICQRNSHYYSQHLLR